MLGMSLTKLLQHCSAFLAVLLCSCSATGPQFRPASWPPARGATVYVFRPDFQMASAVSPEVYVNGAKAFSLQNNGYGVLALEAGSHVIEVRYSALSNPCSGTSFEPVKHTISVVTGQEYYVRFNLPLPGGKQPRSTFLIAVSPAAMFTPFGLGAIAEIRAYFDAMCKLPLELGEIPKEQVFRQIVKTNLVSDGMYSPKR